MQDKLQENKCGNYEEKGGSGGQLHEGEGSQDFSNFWEVKLRFLPSKEL